MVELFIAGDPFWMGLISCPLLVIVLIATNPYHGLLSRMAFTGSAQGRSKSIRALGLFAFIFGLFCQLLGLYGALQSIRVWGEVPANILFQGLGVSFINSGYGLLIFMLAILLSKMIGKQATPAIR